jgi:hypothetical protein
VFVQRRGQPEIVEGAWAQLVNKRVNVRVQLFGIGFERGEPLINFRLFPASLLQHAQLQYERSELLAEMVVQITRDTAALFLLCEDNSPQ